jgi:uncharacterized protein YbjT (DUF2867 family)
MTGDADRPIELLVTGATGLVGGELLDLALAEARIGRVVSVGRRRTGVRHPRLEEVIADLDGLADAEVAGSVDAAVCCIGTTMRRAGSREAFRAVDLGGALATGRLGQRLGAASFALVSSIGADPDSRSFYLRTKGEAERAVAELGFERTVILRPSLLAGERHEVRLGERIGGVLLGAVAPLMVGRLRRWRPIPARTVARATLESLCAPSSAGMRILESDAIADLGG